MLAGLEVQRETFLAEIENIQTDLIALLQKFGRRKFNHGNAHVFLQFLNSACKPYPLRSLRWCFYETGNAESRQLFVGSLQEILADAARPGHDFLHLTLAQISHLPLLEQLFDVEWQRVLLNTRLRQCRNMLLALDQLMLSARLREDYLTGKYKQERITDN